MSTPAREQIDTRLWITAQLQPADLPAVAAAGFRSVINNRPDFEGGPSQPSSQELAVAAHDAGLGYVHLPVPPSGHTQDQAREMVAAVEELPGPVLAFCRTGRRSAALYQRGKEGR